jgi:hypothetical protein
MADRRVNRVPLTLEFDWKSPAFPRRTDGQPIPFSTRQFGLRLAFQAPIAYDSGVPIDTYAPILQPLVGEKHHARECRA